jgi:hypothetical protein
MENPLTSLTSMEGQTKRLNCVINGLYMNQNSTLLSIATNSGYKIFESYNYFQVSEDDEIHDLIGPLKICLTLYESHVVFFVGKEENQTFPSTQLVIWDDMKRNKIGVIMLKDKIADVKVNKEAIYIMIPNKIIVFGMKTLSYICTIHDVDHLKSQKLCMSISSNPVILLHVPNTRSNQVKVTKCKIIYNSNSPN